MMYTIDTNFSVIKQGDKLALIEDTCSPQICDICGKKRLCVWFEQKDKLVGMDICRRCRKEHLMEVNG